MNPSQYLKARAVELRQLAKERRNTYERQSAEANRHLDIAAEHEEQAAVYDKAADLLSRRADEAAKERA